MIWNDERLIKACLEQELVSPFDRKYINPGSIDLRLDKSYRLPDPMWDLHPVAASFALSNGQATWGPEYIMDDSGFWLPPHQFILCCSLEFVRIPVDAVAHLYSKSSTGRKGLEHLHAGLGDAGFCGQWTWEFINVAPWPILMVPGQPLMQMEIHCMIAPAAKDYSKTGRYQNQVGATPERQAR